MIRVSNESLGCPLSLLTKNKFPEQQTQPLGGGKYIYKTRKKGPKWKNPIFSKIQKNLILDFGYVVP